MEPTLFNAKHASTPSSSTPYEGGKGTEWQGQAWNSVSCVGDEDLIGTAIAAEVLVCKNQRTLLQHFRWRVDSCGFVRPG